MKMAKKEFPEGFVEALTWLCNRYDEESGEYPESHYEGMALLQYYFETQRGKKMKSIEREAIVLEAEPHDIAAIPAASLWELCRNFDAEADVHLGGNYVGLQLFRHFKRLMETRRVSAENGSVLE
jgi:hypothetical protein